MLCGPQSLRRIPSPLGKARSKRLISQPDPAGGTLREGKAGPLTRPFWSDLEDVRTGLALESGLGQQSPSPLEHEFVYTSVVGRGNRLGKEKAQTSTPFPMTSTEEFSEAKG